MTPRYKGSHLELTKKDFIFRNIIFLKRKSSVGLKIFVFITYIHDIFIERLAPSWKASSSELPECSNLITRMRYLMNY